MKRVLQLLLILNSHYFSVISQTITYDDVAVIVNDNSQTSIEIGNYFQQQRNIPNQNIIHISAPTYEEIDSLEFEIIRAQIENYLVNNNLVDSISYLVSTKGVPLKIERGNCNQISLTSRCSSFDSEIALILGPFSGGIGQPNKVTNPYYGYETSFNREWYGIYLVTRLDGYTKEDVFNLIDRSGPMIGLNKNSAQAILDVSNYDSNNANVFIAFYQPSNTFLADNGWNVNFHTDSLLLTDQLNVFGYASTNGQPSGAVLNNTWTEGSISSIFYSYSAGTFEASNNTMDNLNIPDLISEGATAGHGYVYDAYAWFEYFLKTEILFSRYLNEDTDYNLAESYFMAEPTLSWFSVIVGDPKTSVLIDNQASVFEQKTSEARVFPNPATNIIGIKLKGIEAVEIYNVLGEMAVNLTFNNHDEVSISLEDLKNGVYYIKTITSNEIVVSEVVLNK